MIKNIYIVSAKYSPGLFKEFLCLGGKIEESGYNVIYILSQAYRNIASEYSGVNDDVKSSKYHYIFSSSNTKEMIVDSVNYKLKISDEINKLFLEQQPDLIIIYNPHPINHLLLAQAKKTNPSCKTAIYLHEPYKPDVHLFGVLGSLYYRIVDLFQELSVKNADIIIVPSPCAMELFKIRFPNFPGDVHMAPILIPDRPVKQIIRKFYTIAGRMNEAKGLGTFCELIEYAAAHKLDFQFRILTSNNINSYVNSLSQAAKKITLIETPKLITDREMFEAHAESKAFFLLHTTGTQSGAMTVAFMHGTPVIARNIPAFSQFILDEQNSCLVTKNCKVEELIEVMSFVESNNESLSIQARKSFEEIFSEQNWHGNYQWLTNLFE